MTFIARSFNSTSAAEGGVVHPYLIKAAFIMYPTGGGGQRILGGDLKFLEQKKGGYENCLNISGGMLIFCKILSSFCNGFKRWEKKR